VGEKFGDPVERLLAAFPDLAGIRFYTDDPYHFPGPYFAFGAFTSYIEALQESGLNPESLKKAYAFVEEMATSGDDEAHNIVGITMCEGLASGEFLDNAFPHMGPVTRKTASEIASSLGKPQPGQSKVYLGVDPQRYRQLFAEEVTELGGPENVHEFVVSEVRARVLRRLKGKSRKGKARYT
jgi:hypothetical protein